MPLVEYFSVVLPMNTKVLSIVLALVFLASGGAKLAGLPFELAAFERWGYPLWFMYLTGALEVAGGCGLLVRRLSALAGGCLALLMVGAVITHVRNSEWSMLLIASTILALSALRAWLGSDDIRILAGRK